MERSIVLFTGVQRFCAELRREGFGIAALHKNDEDLSLRTDVDYRISYDPLNLDELRNTIKNLPFKNRITAVFNRRELRVREAAVCNEALGSGSSFS